MVGVAGYLVIVVVARVAAAVTAVAWLPAAIPNVFVLCYVATLASYPGLNAVPICNM